MKFFIDTANLDQIKEAKDLGILDGVTTNPSLMAKEGITGTKNIKNHYAKIAKLVDGDVSAEVNQLYFSLFCRTSYPSCKSRSVLPFSIYWSCG